MSHNLPRSPLAPALQPHLPPLAGVRIATANSGTRYRGRPDLLLLTVPKGTSVAGLLTRSTMPGAPVEWCRRHLGTGETRGVVVNAGNANVFTGAAGRQGTAAMAAAGAFALGCAPEEMLVASTGVIGQPLDHATIAGVLRGMGPGLTEDAWDQAAAAICTTDTFPKLATASAILSGTTVTINGIAKGSGMIAPDMATLLAFIVTDAALPAPVLAAALRQANARSFNCLTVDGDTSTSDTLLLFATGTAGNRRPATLGDPALKDFRRALAAVAASLAEQVARDGEGASKLVRIRVSGAQSSRAARVIALAIANSPLVKTAIAGGDANWGRIVMAVGKSGEKADRDRLEIRLGGQPVTFAGALDPAYDEAQATLHLQTREIDIAVDVGVGRGRAQVWTCDLTHGYIDINADYRS